MYQMNFVTTILISLITLLSTLLIGQDYTLVKNLFNESVPDIYTGGLGSSVSIDGDFAIVSASSGGIKGKDGSGMAVIYEKQNSSWVEVKRIVQLDGEASDFFGASVSLSGDIAMVGVLRDNDAGEFSGSVLVFSKDAGGLNNWGQVHQII